MSRNNDKHEPANNRTSFSSNRTDEMTSLLSARNSTLGINGEPTHKSKSMKIEHKMATTRIALTWKDLCYEAKIAKTKEVPAHIKKILKSVTGYVNSGEMLAILGPSGAGKTTMLDILACRQKGGAVSGEMLMNGRPIIPGIFRRVSAYVQQEDILHGYLTVRETITYAARLRTPNHVTRDEIDVKANSVMQLLGIDHVADRKIGSEFVRGVSGGEKKRCAIAVELVTDPALIYLDEPTTGLDTFTAMHLLYLLKKLTQMKVAVLFSIHQPRSSIFRLFDSLLLLNGFGEQAYFGTSKDAMGFMESVGVVASEPDNPADFLLDAVSVVRAAENLSKEDFPFLPPPTQSQDIAAAFRSTQLASVTDDVEAIKKEFELDSMLPEALSSPYYRPIWIQVWVVSSRALINKLRDPIATVVAISVALLFAVLVGSIYFRLGTDYSGINDRMGVLFFLTMNTAFSNLSSLAMFLFDRSIYIREHRNGMYRPSAYYFGKVIQDLPISIIVNFFFSVTAYYMIGLQSDIKHFAWFFLIGTLIMCNSYGMCMFISNISKNYAVANVIAPLVLVLYLIPSGFLINLDSIPIIWRWIKYISFFRYGFEALVINEFDGLVFSNGDPNCTVPYANGTESPYNPCVIRGTDYITKQMAFNVEDKYLNIVWCATSAGAYLVLGYICLRLFRQNEGK